MKLTRTPLASAIALILLGSAGYAAPSYAADSAAPAADAQDAVAAPAEATAPGEEKKLGTVVVSGIRASIEQSLDAKKEANTHVEVITAEDIGKMPDKNIADSLMRVPGVTTSSAGANEGGFDEKDRVSMRGTNPSLTQTLINGHAVSSGDWFVLNQSGTVGRSVSFTLLPSELVGKVVVHKTAEASLAEGGVVGSVDIITRKPLDFSEDFTAEASVGLVYADKPGKTDPQFSALFNWKNADDTLGLLIQAFYEKRHLRRDGVEVLNYERIGAGTPIGNAHPDLVGVYYPGLMGSALFEQERKRTGGLIEIEFRPNENFDISLTAFSSKLDAPNYNRNYLFWGSHFINGGLGQSPDAGYQIEDNTLVSATWSPMGNTQYGIYDQISRPDASASSNFVSLDFNWNFNDALTVFGSFGTTRGHGRTPTQDVMEWDVGKMTGAGYQLNGIGSAPDWNLGSENTAVPGNATLDWIFGFQNVDVKDEEQWAQLDGQYEFEAGHFLTRFKFGLRYTSHERSLDGVIAQGPGPGAFNPANWPSGFQNYPSDFGDGLGGNFPDDVWYYTPEQLAQFNDAYTNRDPLTRHYFPAEYALTERNLAGYLQWDFEHGKWSGNVGVRVVGTDEKIDENLDIGFHTAPGMITGSAFGNYIPLRIENDFHDVLPSFNLKYQANDELIFRFALTRTMTRADYSALAGNLSLSPPAQQGAVGHGTASNPNLTPVRSTNFDAALEWYYAPEALLSLSAFYMDLSSYIGLDVVRQQYFTFSSWAPNGQVENYDLTIPVNTSGEVRGVELSWQQPLFEHFGVNANVTLAHGSEADGSALVGLSETTYNVGAYYETERWNARLNYNYRSDFYSGLDRATAFSQAGVGNLSGSLGYHFNDHISVTFDALNLNNPTLRYFALNKNQPRSIYQSGRQYYLNLRLSY